MMITIMTTFGFPLTALLLFLNLESAIADCDCKKVGDSFIVTRLWNIVEQNEWTPEDVIDEFNEGFSYHVTDLNGFEEYLSANTGDNSTVFFFNIFETEAAAAVAQAGAKEFVAKGRLNGAIVPNQFTQDHMSYHITADTCLKSSDKDLYLATRLWALTEGTNYTAEDVADAFEEGYGLYIALSEGFVEHGGAIVADKDMVFFYDVFETEAGAIASNDGAAAFVEQSPALNGNIEKVVFTHGQIGFDYNCAGVLPTTPPLCPDCKFVRNTYIITRLWNIVDTKWTPQDVIDEFNKGFAPAVTGLPTFQEYLAAYNVDDNSTVFFFNIFGAEVAAVAAQTGARNFVSSGALNGVITPNQFTQGLMSFHIASEACVTKSTKGKYLSTRLWKLTDNSNFTTRGVADAFEKGYAPIVSHDDGFLEYGGAFVKGTEYIFFYNVFETEQGAISATKGAYDFMESSALKGNIEKVVFTQGPIRFDYYCSGVLDLSDSKDVKRAAGHGARGLLSSISIVFTVSVSLVWAVAF